MFTVHEGLIFNDVYGKLVGTYDLTCDANPMDPMCFGGFCLFQFGDRGFGWFLRAKKRGT